TAWSTACCWSAPCYAWARITGSRDRAPEARHPEATNEAGTTAPVRALTAGGQRGPALRLRLVPGRGQDLRDHAAGRQARAPLPRRRAAGTGGPFASGLGRDPDLGQQGGGGAHPPGRRQPEDRGRAG